MVGIGMVVVTLGIIGLIWGIFQKVKAGRVADAPLVGTGDAAQRGSAVAGPKGQISAQGNVVCPQPLTAPFSGTPCLYYRIKCTAEWKEGDTNKSKILDDQKVAAQFSIDDGTGPVFVDATEGGDFEPSQTKRDTKGTGLLGGITGTDLLFGSYRVQTGMLSLGTKYSVEEEILPLVPRLYACGRVAEQGGAIKAPAWRSLILSQKSRDELLASATKGAKTFLLGGAGAFVLGSVVAIIGQVTADKPAESTTTASAALTTATPSATAPNATTEATPTAVPAAVTSTTTGATTPTTVAKNASAPTTTSKAAPKTSAATSASAKGAGGAASSAPKPAPSSSAKK